MISPLITPIIFYAFPKSSCSDGRMNLIFLFLTRSDLDSIPRIKNWLNNMGKVDVVTAFVNPHLAIDPSEDQVKLENKIIEAMQSTLIVPEERISMELDLQKRW